MFYFGDLRLVLLCARSKCIFNFIANLSQLRNATPREALPHDVMPSSACEARVAPLTSFRNSHRPSKSVKLITALFVSLYDTVTRI